MKTPYQKYYSRGYIEKRAACVNTKWVKIVQSRLVEIPFSSKKKVLDVACGVSTFGKLFSDDIYGFDLNPEAVKSSQKNGIQAKIGNVEKRWNYPDKYFDIVIASHIIEHITNPDHLILEAKRVLKKNGTLIVATPNLAAWFNRILLFAGFQPFFTEVSTIDKTLGLKFTRKLTATRNPLGHLRIFTPGSLKDLLELHEFKIVKCTGTEFGSFPTIVELIDRIISNVSSLASCIIIIGKKS